MRFLGIFLTALMLFSAPVLADTAKDIETLTRAIGFIQGGPSGNVDMAVVFDPSNAESSAHADTIVGLASSPKLKGIKTPVGSVGGSSAKVFFVTRGMKGHYETILNKAVANGGVTVSTDDACLSAGACVLVIKTQPAVDILVSTAASSRTGTTFASAFSMMITKR